MAALNNERVVQINFIFLSAILIACVAGVRKGRGRELGRETTREGGGRREEGNACKEAIVFAIPPTD